MGKLTIRDGGFIEFFQSLIIQQCSGLSSRFSSLWNIDFFNQVGRNQDILFICFLNIKTG